MCAPRSCIESGEDENELEMGAGEEGSRCRGRKYQSFAIFHLANDASRQAQKGQRVGSCGAEPPAKQRGSSCARACRTLRRPGPGSFSAGRGVAYLAASIEMESCNNTRNKGAPRAPDAIASPRRATGHTHSCAITVRPPPQPLATGGQAIHPRPAAWNGLAGGGCQ